MTASTGWGRASWGAGPWGNGLAIDGVETSGAVNTPMVTGAATGFVILGTEASAMLGDIIVSRSAQVELTGISASFTLDTMLVWGLVPSTPTYGNWAPAPTGSTGGWAPVQPSTGTGWTPVVT